MAISRYLWKRSARNNYVLTLIWGLYKFERLAFGVKVLPTIFQQVMDIMLSELEFTIAYQDDILMNSQSAEQHKAHVYEGFKTIQDNGFKIRERSAIFFLTNHRQRR